MLFGVDLDPHAVPEMEVMSFPDFADLLTVPHIMTVFAHWDRLRDGRPVPARADFDPLAIVSALPHVYLAQRETDGTWRKRLVGTGFRAVFGEDVTGKTFDELLSGHLLEATLAAFDYAYETGDPQYVELLIPNPDRTISLFYRRLLLPMSDEAGACTFALGVHAIDPAVSEVNLVRADVVRHVSVHLGTASA